MSKTATVEEDLDDDVSLLLFGGGGGGGERARIVVSLDDDDDNHADDDHFELNNFRPSLFSGRYDHQRRCRCRRHHHMVAHFDVNETIWVGDDAGGDTRAECFHKMIAKNAFVRRRRIDDDGGSSVSGDVSGGRSSTRDDDDDSWKQRLHEMKPTHWWDGTPITDGDDDDDDDDGDDVIDDGGGGGSGDDACDGGRRRRPPLPRRVPLYVGWDWPDRCCPYYRTSYKSKSKAFCRCDSSGDSGNGDGATAYRDIYERLVSAMPTWKTMMASSLSPSPLPDAHRRATDEEEVTTTATSRRQQQQQDAVYLPQFEHMLPAFFDALVALFPSSAGPFSSADSDNRPEENGADKGGRERLATTKVTVALRTFGTDLPQVACAIRAFARGRHPMYPRYRNRDLAEFAAAKNDQLYIGRWCERNETTKKGDGDDSTTRNEINNNTDVDHDDIPSNAVFQLWTYGDDDDDNDSNNGSNGNERRRLVASGDDEVLEVIHSHSICGIRDDYPYWKRHRHRPWAGKPVWKLESPTLRADDEDDKHNNKNRIHYHHILFDDNIHNLSHDSIACVREQILPDNSNEPPKFRTLNGFEILQQQGIHLVRVPTICPILDRRWFLRQIRRSVRLSSTVPARRDERIKANNDDDDATKL